MRKHSCRAGWALTALSYLPDLQLFFAVATAIDGDFFSRPRCVREVVEEAHGTTDSRIFALVSVPCITLAAFLGDSLAPHAQHVEAVDGDSRLGGQRVRDRCPERLGQTCL
jgi:hypothetical protein